MRSPKYLAKVLSRIIGARWIEKWYISHTLECDDDFPSLLSLKRVLGEIGLDSFAIEYTIDELKGMSPPLPIIAEMETNVRYYVVVKGWTDDSIYIDNAEGDVITIPTSEFILYSTHKYLIVDWSLRKGEGINSFQLFTSKLLKQGIELSVVVSLSLSLGVVVYSISEAGVAWLLSALLWLSIYLVSLVIVQRKRRQQLRSICKGEGWFDCNLILDSDVSKVTAFLGWGDVGAIYALFSLLTLLWVPHDQFGLTISTLLFAIATLYSLYSLYYQFIKAQVICVLCTSVQILILLGLIANVSFLGGLTLTSSAVLSLVLVSPLVLLGAIGIHYATSYFQLPSSASLEDRIFRQLKREPEVFHLQLSKSKHLSEVPKDHMKILRHSFKDFLVLVVNPGCPICMQELKKMLHFKRKSPQLSISILWLAGEPRMLQAQRYIMSRFYDLNEESFQGFLEWFVRDYPSSISKCVKNLDTVAPETLEQVDTLNSATVRWAKANNIYHTPTLLLNHVILPEFYTLDDIIHIYS